MKVIDNRSEYKEIREIGFGEGFFHTGRLYIRTGDRDQNHDVICLNTTSGTLQAFNELTEVAAAHIELVITDGN